MSAREELNASKQKSASISKYYERTPIQGTVVRGLEKTKIFITSQKSFSLFIEKFELPNVPKALPHNKRITMPALPFPLIELSPAEEAEELVRASLSPIHRNEIFSSALDKLAEAYSSKAPETSIWLDACCRMQISDATPYVISLLEAPWNDNLLFAAADAARGIVQSPLDKKRVTDKLCSLVDSIVAKDSYVAGRSLFTIILFSGLQKLPFVTERLRSWPPHTMFLSLERITSLVYNTYNETPICSSIAAFATEAQETLDTYLATDTPENDDSFFYSHLLKCAARIASLYNRDLERVTNSIYIASQKKNDILKYGAALALSTISQCNEAYFISSIERNPKSNELMAYIARLTAVQNIK